MMTYDQALSRGLLFFISVSPGMREDAADAYILKAVADRYPDVPVVVESVEHFDAGLRSTDYLRVVLPEVE